MNIKAMIYAISQRTCLGNVCTPFLLNRFHIIHPSNKLRTDCLLYKPSKVKFGIHYSFYITHLSHTYVPKLYTRHLWNTY